MTYACPSGHSSARPDVCDVCELPMSGSASLPRNPIGPIAPEVRCAGCGRPRIAAANFCHHCGARFALEPEAPTPPVEPVEFEILIAPDRAYYDRTAATGASPRPAFPDYAPPRTVTARGTAVEIGRRARPAPDQAMPQVNLALAPAADVGVSALHAVLRHEEGEWTVTDVGSKNGTVVDGAVLEAQAPVRLGPDSVIHIGYWTSIRVRRKAGGEAGR